MNVDKTSANADWTCWARHSHGQCQNVIRVNRSAVTNVSHRMVGFCHWILVENMTFLGCAQLVCPAGQSCFNGAFCVPSSGTNCAHSGECPDLALCREGRCVPDPCRVNGGKCPPEHACSPVSTPEGECRHYQVRISKSAKLSISSIILRAHFVRTRPQQKTVHHPISVLEASAQRTIAIGKCAKLVGFNCG